MIEREKMVKIEQEIRNIVDEVMRSELEVLQAAYDRDRAHKGKKTKKPQKKVNDINNIVKKFVTWSKTKK